MTLQTSKNKSKLKRFLKLNYERILSHSSNILHILKYKNKFGFSYLDIKNKTTDIGENLHNEIIKRIIVAYNKSKKAQENAPLAYQVGGDWNIIINKDYGDLIKNLQRQDIEGVKSILKNFCRVCSRGLEMSSDYESLMKNNFFYHSYFYLYRFNRSLDIWRKYVRDALNELNFPNIGNPFGMNINGNLIPICSIRHNYYAKKLLALSTNIKNPVICEIGGGFGGMAYYLLKKEKIKYINFDIPEIVAIISYFLMLAYPNKKFKLFSENIGDADITLMPNFEFPKLKDNSVDIVFNSHSFIEMDDYTILEYIKQINRVCKRYFLHINHYITKNYKKGFQQNTKISKLYPKSFTKIYVFPELFAPVSQLYDEYLCEKKE